jgi:outer membrane protein assembly factor BamB
VLSLGKSIVATNAQSISPNYWQYSASGRLVHAVAADVNHDSIDEFLVVDDNGKVDLLSASGSLQWSYSTGEPITSIGTVNIEGSSHPQQEIILGTRRRLTLLTVDGEVLWEIDILLAPASLSPAAEGQGPAELFTSEHELIPIAVAPFDHDNNGRQEILVLLESGQLHLYDANGTIIWHYSENSNLEAEPAPKMAVGDLDGDGQPEVSLGRFDPNRRFSLLTVLDGTGKARWEQDLSVSGRITGLALVAFDGYREPLIAVGNNIGQVNIYDAQRQRLWQRTLNRPITDMTAAHLADGRGLVVGTGVGSIVAFNGEGRRIWTRYLAPDANRSIVDLSAIPFAPAESQPTLSAIVSSIESNDEPADVLLLASTGRTLDTFTAVDTAKLTRLTDINRDGNSELLLARFSQVELLGLGLGASEIAKGWDYNLLSFPQSVLIEDLDQDGTDELIIGTQDGRIHSLDNSKSIRWLHAPGGAITHLAAMFSETGGAPNIVAVRNNALPGSSDELIYESWLELRQANGKQIWEIQFPARINALMLAESHDQEWPEIIVGTATGEIKVFSAAGELIWDAVINDSVEHLLVLEDVDSRESKLIAASVNQVFGLSQEQPIWRIAVYEQEILDIHPIIQPGKDLEDTLLVLLADGTIRSRAVSRGVQLARWKLELSGLPTARLAFSSAIEDSSGEPATESLIITTEGSELIYLNIEDSLPVIAWQQSGFNLSTSLLMSDLDGDALMEMAVGNRDGIVQLFKIRSSGEPQPLTNLDLSSSVFALKALHRERDQESDLLTISDNGLVQLFRAQDNWPPLLTNPRADATENQYSIVVSVQDIENDQVMVRLDVHDAGLGEWIPQGEKQLSNGEGTLFWLVDNIRTGSEGVGYRFHYDDGFHQGYVLPPEGPVVPVAPATVSLSPANLSLLGLAGVFLVFVLVRQSQLPGARARRFHRRLRQQPTLTLTLLEKRYAHTDGSPDFLLHLASQDRQRGDSLVASLADGLFLLADQPHAGMPIILSALENVPEREAAWKDIERWRMTYRIGQALLEAPTVTELTLLRPQLVGLFYSFEETNYWSPSLDALLPILTSLRDSERVDLAEDRIVYLNEAAILLERLKEQLPELSARIEKTMVVAILSRWSSLVSAEIEDLYGRAELTIQLKTKRIVPSSQTDIVLEVSNNGRAAAENIIAELGEDPAYVIHSAPEVVRLLPPGRARQLNFTIEPKVSDRFRIALDITYDDRSRRDKMVAFGDMVHLLPPVREFRPIANPYLPGTALRRNSSIFYGRKNLFDFIAENAGELSQRNVLILVGERRTGKTSVLLRLEEHLPKNLIPVYIDCQSLGVISGMPALLHDLSWYVADALALRGIVVDVPEPVIWQEDPSGLFQRRFLPQVRSLLPADATLLLVFDEFEAFENLVDDGIIPSILFPYLRHLMQHSEGLSFVFVGTRRLEEMSADYWSVLFNIALYRKIGYLSDESATRLICEPVEPNLIYDDLALDKILRVTTGHPYFLQLVCYTLVKRANAHRSAYATVSDVNAALDEMLRLGEVHFAYLWQRSSQVERMLLTAMAHLMDRDVPFHPADLMKYLKPYGIHLSPSEVTTALNRLMERDIVREVSEGATMLYELKIGLVGLWVARYKSLSTLLTGNGEQRVGMTRKA